MLRAKRQRPCDCSAERNVSQRLCGGALWRRKSAPTPSGRCRLALNTTGFANCKTPSTQGWTRWSSRCSPFRRAQQKGAHHRKWTCEQCGKVRRRTLAQILSSTWSASEPTVAGLRIASKLCEVTTENTAPVCTSSCPWSFKPSDIENGKPVATRDATIWVRVDAPWTDRNTADDAIKQLLSLWET